MVPTSMAGMKKIKILHVTYNAKFFFPHKTAHQPTSWPDDCCLDKYISLHRSIYIYVRCFSYGSKLHAKHESFFFFSLPRTSILRERDRRPETEKREGETQRHTLILTDWQTFPRKYRERQKGGGGGGGGGGWGEGRERDRDTEKESSRQTDRQTGRKLFNFNRCTLFINIFIMILQISLHIL